MHGRADMAADEGIFQSGAAILRSGPDFLPGKVLPTGVEPVTLGLLDPRSNRLSYESYGNRWHCCTGEYCCARCWGKVCATAGSRTRVARLEGGNLNRWTTVASTNFL